MTKPRTNISRELFGILGSPPNKSALQKEWNKYFTDHGIDAFMDVYPATEANLHERLSEMYHFDRRGYIVDSALAEAVFSLLDSIDTSTEQGTVTVVRNNGGVLEGFHFVIENTSPEELYDFFAQGSGSQGT